MFSEKTMSREKAMSLGLPFLAGALVFLGKNMPRSYVSRIGVPSRGFCFLRKTCPGKSHVSRVGVPSRGFCFLRITCPEKSYVSRVAVPSRGFCFLKNMSRKKLRVCGRIHSDRLDALPLLPILKGRVGSPNKRPAPICSKSRASAKRMVCNALQ